MKVVSINRIVKGIPVLEVYDVDLTSKRPIIMILHGFLGSKEGNFEVAGSLAKDGFFVVMPDAFLHGEQSSKEFEDVSIWKKAEKLDEIFFNTTGYIDKVISSYKGSDLADYDRFALIGVSMGGCIIFNYLARYRKQNLKAAVPIIATVFWANHLKAAQAIPDASGFINDDLISRVAAFEPSNFVNEIKDVPLLMVNGDADDLMPIEDIRKGYELIRNNYSDKGKISLREFKGVGHVPTPEMFSEAVSWVKQHI